MMPHSARPLGTCSDSIQCAAAIDKRRLATLPAGPSKCHGAVPALGVQGRCVVELPPEPWNFTCEYKYPAGGRPRGSPLLKTGEPCLPLTEHSRVKEGSFNGEHEEWTSSKKSRGASPLSKGPRVAVMIVGLAAGVTNPLVYASMRHRLIESISEHVDVFMNLEIRADIKDYWSPKHAQETLIRAGEAGSIGKGDANLTALAVALLELRPRFVTLNEPAIEGFAGPRNDWFSKPGSRNPDSRCAGHAWRALKQGHHPKVPYDRLLRARDRHRRCMLLVELAESRDAQTYAWVVMTRPDLVFNVPVTHHMLRANTVYWKGHVDFSLFVPRSAATTFFVDATLSYWRCEQISETSGEGWITKGFLDARDAHQVQWFRPWRSNVSAAKSEARKGQGERRLRWPCLDGDLAGP